MTTTMRDEQASGNRHGVADDLADARQRATLSGLSMRQWPVGTRRPTRPDPECRTGSLPAASRPPRASEGLIPADRICELPDTGGHHLASATARAWWARDQRFHQRFPGTALHHRLLPNLAQHKSCARPSPNWRRRQARAATVGRPRSTGVVGWSPSTPMSIDGSRATAQRWAE